MLPEKSFFAIKEPYFTVAHDMNSWYIRVDHPGNIVRLTSESRHLGLEFGLKSQVLASPDWKAAGNEAIKSDTLGGYARAMHCYSEGLRVVGGDKHLRADLLRNRAYANIELGRYDAAESDALASILDTEAGTAKYVGDLNYKAYRRASMAAYKLRKW